ncbi:hypothetical protein GTY65_34855 [Streptomyces sp. SID8379]|uniref:hypothetical protein n=1 Tax=unclassified Streptomyces TaxID=2593676 RepID=UPI0003752C86|nr:MULTISPECIES: hypothetical protein [unclassified Streptomyces]MYW69212.1 hypothetical protein [Streptomyces sp. SID8379]
MDNSRRGPPEDGDLARPGDPALSGADGRGRQRVAADGEGGVHAEQGDGAQRDHGAAHAAPSASGCLHARQRGVPATGAAARSYSTGR